MQDQESTISEKCFVNEGSPAQADLAAEIVAALDDPDLYPDQ